MPASLSDHLVLRVFSPSPLLTTEEALKDLANQVNVQLDLVTTLFRNLFGEAGDAPVTFQADVNLASHRLLNVADPEAETDGTNRRFVTSLIEGLQDEVNEVHDTVHEGTPGSGEVIVLQRTLPTTVDDIVEIGNFALLNNAHTFDIAVTVSDASFSVAKAWTIVTCASINTDWQIALPIFDSGPFGGSAQNFALDIKQDDSSNILLLRLRRTGGSVAGTANIFITPRGLSSDQFTEMSGTASVTAPTTFLQSAILSVKDGNVVVGTTVAAGTSAAAVLMMGASTAPSTSPVDVFQMYALDVVAGNKAPHFRTELGSVIRLFLGAALTAADAGVVDATYGAPEAAVINNLRVRLGELELRLQAHGLLA